MLHRLFAVAMAAMVLGLGFASAASAQQVVNVPAGKRTLVGLFTLYNSDACTSAAVPEGRVSAAPAHGSIELVMEQHRISAGRCGGIMAWSRAVYYTPRAGFRGPDQVTVNFVYELFSEGSERGNQSATYRMNVR